MVYVADADNGKRIASMMWIWLSHASAGTRERNHVVVLVWGAAHVACGA